MNRNRRRAVIVTGPGEFLDPEQLDFALDPETHLPMQHEDYLSRGQRLMTLAKDAMPKKEMHGKLLERILSLRFRGGNIGGYDFISLKEAERKAEACIRQALSELGRVFHEEPERFTEEEAVFLEGFGEYADLARMDFEGGPEAPYLKRFTNPNIIRTVCGKKACSEKVYPVSFKAGGLTNYGYTIKHKDLWVFNSATFSTDRAKFHCYDPAKYLAKLLLTSLYAKEVNKALQDASGWFWTGSGYGTLAEIHRQVVLGDICRQAPYGPDPGKNAVNIIFPRDTPKDVSMEIMTCLQRCGQPFSAVSARGTERWLFEKDRKKELLPDAASYTVCPVKADPFDRDMFRSSFGVRYRELFLFDFLRYNGGFTREDILRTLGCSISEGWSLMSAQLFGLMFGSLVADMRREQERRKVEGEGHARSFETKKGIPKSTLAYMESSGFNKTFGYLELDERCDIAKVEEVRQQFDAFKERFLPKADASLVSLRFKRLGNHKAAGLYYPTLKCLCVDINNPGSFVHEFGHMLDYTSGELSLRADFAPALVRYRGIISESKALKERKGKYSLDYFTEVHEVFARCFEMYFTEVQGLSCDLVKDAHGPEYPREDRELMGYIKTYFDGLLSGLGFVPQAEDTPKAA